MDIDPQDVQICLGHDETPSAQSGAMAPPIVQTSLFAFGSHDDLHAGLGAEHSHHVYTRGQNPTVEAFERKMAALERGEACKAFASGMAAISAAMLGTLEAGNHVLFVNQVYGPTLHLARHLQRFGIEHDYVLDLDPASVAKAIRPHTRIIWFESPGTMLFRLVDVDALVDLARDRGVLTVMDNTWATPLLQKPLPRGVDLVVHSCTKYVGGHSDVVAGALIGSAELIQQIFYRAFLLNGAVLGPFDAWLLIRGLRTLPARLREHEAAGLAVAEFLHGHPAVRAVYHPKLREAGPALDKHLSGYSGLFSFELVDGTYEAVRSVVDALQLFRIGVSWGGAESLVLSPNRGSNAGGLARHRIPAGLIRLSIGLEGADALIVDLDRALPHP